MLLSYQVWKSAESKRQASTNCFIGLRCNFHSVSILCCWSVSFRIPHLKLRIRVSRKMIRAMRIASDGCSS